MAKFEFAKWVSWHYPKLPRKKGVSSEVIPESPQARTAVMDERSGIPVTHIDMCMYMQKYLYLCIYILNIDRLDRQIR